MACKQEESETREAARGTGKAEELKSALKTHSTRCRDMPSLQILVKSKNLGSPFCIYQKLLDSISRWLHCCDGCNLSLQVLFSFSSPKFKITRLSLFLSVQCSLSVNIQGGQEPQAIRMNCPTLSTQQEVEATANFRWAPVPWLKARPKALIFISIEPASYTKYSGDMLFCVSCCSETTDRRTFGDGCQTIRPCCGGQGTHRAHAPCALILNSDDGSR